MAKKRRNSIKVRQQEYPDMEEFESSPERDEPDYRDFPEPPSKTVRQESPAAYRDGQVVVCPDKQKCGDGLSKHGTVIQCVGKDLLVLDSEGHIHQCQVHEVYLAQ